MVKNDPQHGARGIPNCVCWGKTLETEEVEYRLNSHGFRTGMEWGPKEPGVYRIVMIGSSIAMGYRVARNKMFAELLPGEISKRTGRKVDLYNKGVMWGTPHSITLRFDDVLAAEPDSILWVLSETDIKEASALLPLQEPRMSHAEPANALDRRFGSLRRFRMALATESIPDAIGDMLKNTGARVLLQHYLNESQSQYLKSYLSGQEEAGFLRAEPSAEWMTHLHEFDYYVGEIEARARAAGVPLVVVLVPDRAQAAMISMGEWPAGYDPYKLGEEVRTIVVSHGGTYIDILPDFRNIPNPEQYYLPVDGHPNAEGHAIIAGLLARELTSGAIPELRVHPPAQQSTLEQRR
jgi:hypothetical protein